MIAATMLLSGAVACGGETIVEKVVQQTVVVEKPVEKVVQQTVVVEKPVEKVVQQTVVVEKLVEKVVVATPTAGPAAPSPGAPSGTLTVAWSNVFSFIGIPSKNGGRQGERLVWLGVHETALRQNEQAQMVPHLAESWEASQNGLQHTLKLRKGVKYHGNFGEMTADDWKWTAEDQWVNKDSNHGGQFIARSRLEKIEVVDPYTVRFVLKTPNAFFREYYGSIRDDVGLAVYSKKRVDGLGVDKATTSLPDGGTGPWQIDSWKANTEIQLSVFKDYWGPLPEYEKIRVLQISESSTVLAALKTGEIDAAKIPVTLQKDVEASGLQVRNADVGFASVVFSGQFCITEFQGKSIPPRPGYDPSLPWVGDCSDPPSMEKAKKVRDGMNIAIDRQALVDSIVGGLGRSSYVQMLQGYFADRYMQPKWIVEYNRDKAKQLIAEGGYPNGFSFQLVCTEDHLLSNEFCQAIAGFWEQIGLKPQIQRLEPATLRQQLVKREFNGVRIGVGTGVSPIPEARGFAESPLGSFNSGYEVPGLTELVDQASLATFQAELDAIRANQYQWAFDQQLNIPVIEFKEVYAVNPKKIGEWPRTPWNGHQEELMDFERLRKPR
jgi:peptide/nickel transport system substrate-binding protein